MNGCCVDSLMARPCVTDSSFSSSVGTLLQAC